MPIRIQLSRRKGWRMPANTMNIAGQCRATTACANAYGATQLIA